MKSLLLAVGTCLLTASAAYAQQAPPAGRGDSTVVGYERVIAPAPAPRRLLTAADSAAERERIRNREQLRRDDGLIKQQTVEAEARARTAPSPAEKARTEAADAKTVRKALRKDAPRAQEARKKAAKARANQLKQFRKEGKKL